MAKVETRRLTNFRRKQQIWQECEITRGEVVRGEKNICKNWRRSTEHVSKWVWELQQKSKRLPDKLPMRTSAYASF